MSENKNTVSTAYNLFESAARKFKQGDFHGAEEDRKEATRIIESIEAAEQAEKDRINTLYGENRNFGVIYSVIEENASEMMKTKEGRKHLGGMLRAIKRTPELKKQFALYEALTSHCPSEHSEAYVEQVMRKVGRINRGKIMEENNRLLDMIGKAKIDEMVEIKDERFELFENIESIMFANDRLSKFPEYASAKKFISEAVSKLTPKQETNNDRTLDDVVKSICESDLNDDEMSLVMEMKAAPDKEALFIKYKDKTLSTIEKKINESKDDSECNYLRDVYAKVDTFKYSPETVYENVAKMAEIESVIND